MESKNGLPQMQKEQGVSPREFILRYVRYLPWLILSLAAAIVIAKIKLRYEVPIYRTDARLLIKRETPSRAGNDKFDDIFSGSSFQNVFNEMELLKSRPLAARVAKAINLQSVCYNKGNIRSTLLYDDAPVALELLPPFDSTATMSLDIIVTDNDHYRVGDEKNQYAFGQTVKVNNGAYRVVKLMPQVHNLYASNEYQLSRISLPDATETVVGGLNVTLADNFAQIINLSFQSQNTNMAEDILNGLMAAYKESNIEDKRQMRISTLEFIDERLDSLRQELGMVEKELTNFIEKNRAFELGKQSDIYLERLNQDASARVQQEIRLSVLNWLIRYLSDKNNAFRAVPVDLGTQEPTLIPLITQYNQLQQERMNALATTAEGNPLISDINARLSKLRNDIVEGLNNVRQAYLITNNRLQTQTNATENRLQSIPGTGQQLAERNRQQKIKEELYLFLLQKKEETAIASASTISDSKIVEPARSSYSPIMPNTKSIYIIAIVLGLALPLGIILLKEYLNDKVRDKSSIQKNTDTPFIGEVGHSDEPDALVVTNHSRRFISEQFRVIRTNLQFILNKVTNPVIMVTSSFSGEGKSFISTNIGAVMAVTGKRSVIIEMDIRKPKIVTNLDLKRQAGLTNFIVGSKSIDDIILKVPDVENLYVIPCGPLPPNPAEMLLDPKVKELFEYVRKRFDVVIVDTAPVGLVSDAMILGEYADCTLYILRQDYTYKKQVHMIDELYKGKKLPRLSLLLNDVEVKEGYGYYYGGYGYGYGYGAGYFDEDGKKMKRGLVSKIKRTFKS